MKKNVFALSLALLIFQCKSSETARMNPDLFGTWNWLSTDGGLGNHIHDTPENSQITFQLKLHKDMSYDLFVNDTKTESGSFELIHKKSLLQKTQSQFILLSEDPNDTGNIVLSGMVTLQKPDTLIISQDVFDGVGSTFKRTN